MEGSTIPFRCLGNPLLASVANVESEPYTVIRASSRWYTTGFWWSSFSSSPIAYAANCSSLKTFCIPLKVLPYGMKAQVMARRQPAVMLAPAPWASKPLWKEQEPAFMGAAMDSMFTKSGYSRKRSDMFSAIGTLT